VYKKYLALTLFNFKVQQPFKSLACFPVILDVQQTVTSNIQSNFSFMLSLANAVDFGTVAVKEMEIALTQSRNAILRA
jgi:hypothetical protein